MKRLVIFLSLAVGMVHAQLTGPPYVLYVGSAPTGACSAAPPVQVLSSTGALYTCNNGTWGAISGGGGVTSLTGDGTIINNSASTGAVTLTLANTPTGTGSVVLATSPTLVTPALGTPASGVITNLTGTCTACTANAATTATNLTGGAIGSVPYQTGSGTTSFLGGNTTTTPNFVTSTGTGAAAQAPTLTGSTGTGAVMLQGSPQVNGTLNIGGGDVGLTRPTGATGEITVTTWLMNSTNACVGSNNTAANNALCLASSGNITEQNQTAATSGANQSGPTLTSGGKYWTGAASATDSWTAQNVLGSGANPTSTLTIAHSGSTGLATVSVPAINVASARKGTFVCTSGGTITISNTNELATSDVIISLNAAGGTISTAPAMKTVTAGTGFTVLCATSDTATYNYDILN